jgi:hypothetical protein
MDNSITEDGLRQYCIEIKTHAIAVCEISYDDLTIEPIKEGTEVNINFELKDNSKWPCIRQIISNMLNSIPPPTKSILELFLLETDKGMNKE